MGRRIFARTSRGRFTRATTENMLGLHTDVCPQCRRLSPYGVGKPPPAECHACGAVMRPKARCGRCEAEVTLLAGAWTDGDGHIACTATGAPLSPHQPGPEGGSEGEGT
jgi:hypothetical protein